MNAYGPVHQYGYPNPPQYTHPPASPNGHYPPFLLPHPHHPHPPGTPYVTFPHNMPHLLPPPPQNHIDVNGWYNHSSNQPNVPLHPPGLTVPVHIHKALPPTSEEGPRIPDVFPHSLEIHEFWRGRLAPLPGFSSRPTLLPMREQKQPENPTSPKSDTPTKGLLPPPLPVGTRPATSPGLPLKKLKNDEKIEVRETFTTEHH